MRTITAPGVEIKEIDKSQYSPAMTGTTCYVMGFADSGEAYLPMEFTSRAAWVNYYGEPDNEAERYFYNACVEVLNNNGRLYCARLPYDNESFQKAIGFKYTVTGCKDLTAAANQFAYSPNNGMTYSYADLTDADASLDKVCLIKPKNCPEMLDLIDEVDEWQSGESKPADSTFVIVDRTFGTYRNADEAPGRKGKRREMLGIVPVVTTAANAMLAQNLITVNKWNVKYYETAGNVVTQVLSGTYDSNTPSQSNNIISAASINTTYFNEELVQQLNTACKEFVLTANIVSIELSNLEATVNAVNEVADKIADISGEYSLPVLSAITYKTNSNWTCQTIVESLNSIANTLLSANPKKNLVDSDENSEIAYNDIFHDLIEDCIVSSNVSADMPLYQLVNKVETLYGLVESNPCIAAADGDDQLPDTVSQVANSFFTTVQYDTELSAFKRDNLKDIGVVVFKAYCDPTEGNKIRFEPVESFVGSLCKDDKDPETGITKFLDTIVNSTSQYIYFFSNCFSSSKALNEYNNEVDMLIMQPTSTCPALGFFSEQTKEQISVTKSIYDGINKCFEKVSDINERDIDIICDAGISNIAQFLTAVYKDPSNAAAFDLKALMGDKPAISMWKCEKNDDVKVWKTVIQKLDNFCKNVRKDCMFITECPRPLVLAGDKKIIRPTKPKNTIDVNILPYVKWVTGLNTNYGAGYMDWFEVADEFTGDFMWLPPSIKAMGVYIYTDVNFNYWDAPAGLNRGMIAATDVAFSPTGKQAGSIYEKNWNYAINYPQDGIILEGQKTFQVKPSAFDRINVRRLFLRLERMSYKVARYFVYEGNTAYNRQRLVDALDPYFKEAKIGGGIYDYKIVCDESNNTPTTIDRNELHVSIAIKPVKTIEFIMLDFIAGSTGSTWEELLG